MLSYGEHVIFFPFVYISFFGERLKGEAKDRETRSLINPPIERVLILIFRVCFSDYYYILREEKKFLIYHN